MSEGRRLPRAYLIVCAVLLTIFAEAWFPGGLAPRRRVDDTIGRREVETLEVVSLTSPDELIGGPLPIDDIHRRGLGHLGSWIFALDSHFHLLLAFRGKDALVCPNSWSILGEHAVANESFRDAATRGLAEEARFIVRPRVHDVGIPFLYNHEYRDPGSAQNETVERIDNQWTKLFVVLPRGDALDFRTLHDDPAIHHGAVPENVRYQGMTMKNVVEHAIRNPNYFCHETAALWILRALPLVVRVIKGADSRRFGRYVSDDWEELTAKSMPVCCQDSEDRKPVEAVNVSQCGVPCSTGSDKTLPSDSTFLL